MPDYLESLLATPLSAPLDAPLSDPLTPKKRKKVPLTELPDTQPASGEQPVEDTPETFRPEPTGVFGSVLDEIGKPFQVVGNLLKGNLEGAGRQALDFGTNLVDAVLPGDWIPSTARPQDYTSGSDLLGIDTKEHPYLGFAADIGAGLALDPLTYTGFGPLLKGYQAAGRAGMGALAKVAPEAAAGLANKGAEVARFGRRLVGDTSGLSPGVRDMLAASDTEGAKAASAGVAAIKGSVLSTLPADERELVTAVAHNVYKGKGGVLGKILPDIDPATGQPHTYMERLIALGLPADKEQRIGQALDEVYDIGREQAKQPNVFYNRGGPTGLTDEYLPRAFKGQTADQQVAGILGREPDALGAPSAIRQQVLTEPQDIAGYMAANPGVTRETDALKLMGQRAQAQGTLAARGALGEKLLGKQAFAYADDADRALVNDKIAQMAIQSPEDARWLKDAFSGIGSRSGPMSALAKMSSYFKPYAVYGAFIPRVGSDVRNGIGGVWQVMSNPESRGQTMEALKRLPFDLASSFGRAFGMKDTGKLGTLLSDVDTAMTQSKGLASNAEQALRSAGKDEAADLLKSGVISDGYVRSEEMAAEMDRHPWAQKFLNAMNWPAKIFKGLEDRMRAGLFTGLRAEGKSVEDAARITGDSLYKYNVNSVENRAARDVIPFFQFSAKAIPQQARLLMEKPYLATGLAAAYENNQDPIMPQMNGKLNIPLGMDENGKSQYISGLGLPFESLSNIPNPSADLTEFGREIRQGVVAQAQPLVKSAFADVAGIDPYFGSPYGQYSKVAGQDLGAVGRKFNMAAQAGLAQPLAGPLQQIGQIANPDQGIGEKLLDQLTGANVVGVDPHRALAIALQNELQLNPDIQQYSGLYSQSHDPATKALLKRLQQEKAKVKAQRKAAKE